MKSWFAICNVLSSIIYQHHIQHSAIKLSASHLEFPSFTGVSWTKKVKDSDSVSMRLGLESDPHKGICGEQAEIENWQDTPGCVSVGQKTLI